MNFLCRRSTPQDPAPSEKGDTPRGLQPGRHGPGPSGLMPNRGREMEGALDELAAEPIRRGCVRVALVFPIQPSTFVERCKRQLPDPLIFPQRELAYLETKSRSALVALGAS